MKIQVDKILHFLIGLIAASGITTISSIYTSISISIVFGIFSAMLLEAFKIYLYDIPLAEKELRYLDWVEKRADILAQLLGGVLGAVLAYYVLL